MNQAWLQTQYLVKELFGDDLSGKIATVIGSTGTGKSTMAQQLILYYFTQLKQQNNLTDKDVAVYITTDRGILLERTRQICNAFGWKYTDFSKHFKLEVAKTLQEQHFIITSKLSKIIGYNNCRILVVDCMNHLAFEDWKETTSKTKPDGRKPDGRMEAFKIYKKLDKQMTTLLHLARDNNVFVFLTVFPKKNYSHTIPDDWVRGFFGSEKIPHLSDYVFWVIQNVSSGVIRCTVLKHRTKPTPFNVSFKIQDHGYTLYKD